jgi:hypothetical protein
MSNRTRRDFLANIGQGMLLAGVGSSVALDLGLTNAKAAEQPQKLDFGDLEPLVALMQNTPADKLLPMLVEKNRQGTTLKTLVAAGALANARTFGGEDYIGYHTFMALAPAYAMAQELPAHQQLLPVLKVLHRNTSRMQERGGREHEVLHHQAVPTVLASDRSANDQLQQRTRARDTAGAEGTLAALTAKSVTDAYEALQQEIQDEANVHRVVLSWRAWAMLDLAGQQHAETLLRQAVRYCLQSEQYLYDRKRPPQDIRQQLPKLFDEFKLAGKPLGKRTPDDGWIDQFSRTIYKATPSQGAEAVAAAFAEGIAPDSIAEALCLAANRLVLHDPGRIAAHANADKPAGSVHGDSVGVHASDAANAWRNIARISNPRNTVASLIVGGYHTAGQAGRFNPEPYPLPEQLEQVKTREPAKLLEELDAAVRAKDQFRACAIATQYGKLGGDAKPIFAKLITFATSEDGALHAEKYYFTAREEFERSRPAFRWQQVAALARVSASEYGKPAPGYVIGKELLKG